MIFQTLTWVCRCWKSCSRSQPPALTTSFAKPAPNAFESALHNCLTDEASQVTGLTTLVLRECFHGNRLRSCEEKKKTERERQTEANLQHHVFLTFPSCPGYFVAVHLLHVKKHKASLACGFATWRQFLCRRGL